MRIHVQIDDDRCTGHGRCYSVAPELFECDDDTGYGVVRADSFSGELIEAARLAVSNCPEDAITVTTGKNTT